VARRAPRASTTRKTRENQLIHEGTAISRSNG
jgi:hypothetical protein